MRLRLCTLKCWIYNYIYNLVNARRRRLESIFILRKENEMEKEMRVIIIKLTSLKFFYLFAALPKKRPERNEKEIYGPFLSLILPRFHEYMCVRDDLWTGDDGRTYIWWGQEFHHFHSGKVKKKLRVSRTYIEERKRGKWDEIWSRWRRKISHKKAINDRMECGKHEISVLCHEFEFHVHH